MTRLVVRKPNRTSVFNSPFDAFFNDFFSTPETPATRVKSRPAINLTETNDAFRLDVAAPGLTKADFHLHVEEDILTLKVEKEVQASDDEKIIREGFAYHSLERSFTLGDAINVADINASYEQGILSIHLPKREEAKAEPARHIEIR
ncbi:MAG: Hsp20/alpha crystallin family protein [Saprospiraceae bacterium]|nr:Hsp20/alpha crystallin family protein [Saprospiraceae bacterium]